jgi:uroporphyrinogen decarboxylase
MDHLAEMALASLSSQVRAGCAAVQLFDSWAGALSRADYARYVLPASRRVLEGVAATGAVRIHFGVGSGEFLDLMGEAGAEVVGVDWHVSLRDAAQRVGPGRALQGNLDPAICLAGAPVARAAAERILVEGSSVDGHIFNLGHGVLPETDPGVLAEIVDVVHAFVPGDTP